MVHRADGGRYPCLTGIHLAGRTIAAMSWKVEETLETDDSCDGLYRFSAGVVTSIQICPDLPASSKVRQIYEDCLGREPRH